MELQTQTNSLKHRWFWEALSSFLDSKDLRQTSQRRTVIEYFLNTAKHIDAESLHEIVRKDGHNIGIATIYRTMNLLKDAGLVEQKSFADGRSVFELQLPNSHHDHLICLDCGAVLEFENQDIERLQAKIANMFGFSLASHRLDLFGHCYKRYKSCEHRKKTIKK